MENNRNTKTILDNSSNVNRFSESNDANKSTITDRIRSSECWNW